MPSNGLPSTWYGTFCSAIVLSLIELKSAFAHFAQMGAMPAFAQKQPRTAPQEIDKARRQPRQQPGGLGQPWHNHDPLVPADGNERLVGNVLGRRHHPSRRNLMVLRGFELAQ